MPKPPTTIAEAKALITKHKLDDHRDLILGGLRRAVRLKPGKPVKRRLPTGTSKFGGEPDLPEDAQWPTFGGRPLHFLAQLNLADLPPHHIATADLPRKGLLSFWYDTQGDRAMRAFNHDSARWQAHYSTKAIERRSFPEHDESKYDIGEPWRPFPERRVTMKASLTLSEDAEHELSNRLWKAGNDDERQFHLQAALEGQDIYDHSDPGHRLLGSYRFPQADAREYAAGAEFGLNVNQPLSKLDMARVKRRMKAWRVLLVLQSDHASNWMWSDAGSLSFWIRDADLKKRRFDRIHGELDSA